MARMSGVDAHRRRLRRMRGPQMVNRVTQALFKGAKDIADDAALSITEGATSGANHVPSVAPNPPNADTHVLDRNIEAAITAPLKAEASSNAPYAAAQEFGDAGNNLPERPYMRPAAQRGRPGAVKRVVDAVNRVTGG
jgi:hypothetical protein